MRIAVVGCLHGELDKVYEDIKEVERRQGCQVELVLICGDFQAVRNHHDLTCMAVPPKYRQLGQFHDYYYGRKRAPILTLFIGGNHEASNYTSTLAYGGWVADNIYYMGYASVVRFGGLRIAGVSGIHKSHDARLGHYERLPYNGNSLRSVFHMRHLEIHRLSMISNATQEQPIAIFMSHDWPLNIHAFATSQAQDQLVRQKPFFRQEMAERRLGNQLLTPLLFHLKPRHWFAAHLHVRFAATVSHKLNDERTISTHFLALDKCLPRRKYLEVIDIPSGETVMGEKVLSHDPEWLAILRATDHLLSVDQGPNYRVPDPCDNRPNALREPVSQEKVDEVFTLWTNDLTIAANFACVEPALLDRDTDPGRTRSFPHPHTTEFCRKNAITDPIAKILGPGVKLQNPDEIDLEDDEEEDEEEEQGKQVTELKAGGDEADDATNKKLKTETDQELATETTFVINNVAVS